MARAFAPQCVALPYNQFFKQLRRYLAAISGCVEAFRGWTKDCAGPAVVQLDRVSFAQL
jgi:hypothetical protein